MERREFLRSAFGFAAGAGVLAAAASAASAAPMLSQDLIGKQPQPDMAPKPALADQDDVARAEPEKVQWRRRYHRRRYWGRRRRW